MPLCLNFVDLKKAFDSVQAVAVMVAMDNQVKKTGNTRLRAHYFNTKALPALIYASGTWVLRKQEENARFDEIIKRKRQDHSNNRATGYNSLPVDNGKHSNKRNATGPSHERRLKPWSSTIATHYNMSALVRMIS
ncbi:hypothetical protein RB195_003730 [Necator americanus]|uniref:Reverse transcriptase domain-containing protein n=1 Tax=Necator americanus TaxID=51031 RepID=A0ABR1DPW7_NECAM